MGYSEPWRGLSKSEEAADGDAGGGEMNWDAGFACINSHNAGQYTTCFCGEAKWRRVFSHEREVSCVKRKVAGSIEANSVHNRQKPDPASSFVDYDQRA